MIEGLWIVKFRLAEDQAGDLNGGVIVIETQRLLGGDSGYFYTGHITPNGPQNWGTSIRITRHDLNAVSVFGDYKAVDVRGSITSGEPDEFGRLTMNAVLHEIRTQQILNVLLTKVAELP